MLDRLRRLIIAKECPVSVQHALRTGVAALVSLLVAHLFRMSEAYWAAITTLIVMQSTLGAALPISAQRFAGTAVGAAVGASVGNYYPGNIVVFGLAVFVLGVFCAGLRVERNAYRYATITLAIVMLIARTNSVWIAAVHRFFEVSIGIAIGLVVTALWPEHKIDARAARSDLEQSSSLNPEVQGKRSALQSQTFL